MYGESGENRHVDQWWLKMLVHRWILCRKDMHYTHVLLLTVSKPFSPHIFGPSFISWAVHTCKGSEFKFLTISNFLNSLEIWIDCKAGGKYGLPRIVCLWSVRIKENPNPFFSPWVTDFQEKLTVFIFLVRILHPLLDVAIRQIPEIHKSHWVDSKVRVGARRKLIKVF